MENKVSVVIGSWGSYNECNSRALGSKWLTLNNYKDWDEIEQELTKEGFELKGIDEELFIQDYEGFDGGFNCDCMHPKTLFDILQKAEVLTNDNKFNTMEAFIEVRDWDEFVERIDDKGTSWDDEIYIYKGYDVYDYGKELWSQFGYDYNLPEYAKNFIDYEKFGQNEIDNGNAEKYSNGIIEIVE